MKFSWVKFNLCDCGRNIMYLKYKYNDVLRNKRI